MSNDITVNPWSLDTAADNIVAPGKPSKLRPKKLKWTGEALADGDLLQIENGNEQIVFVHNVVTADEGLVFDFPPDFEMDGFSLGAISNGVCYIYF